jgi:hypothetical protein
MGEVDKNLDSFADDVVAFLAANAGHQAHTTGIMFMPWMIEALRIG